MNKIEMMIRIDEQDGNDNQQEKRIKDKKYDVMSGMTMSKPQAGNVKDKKIKKRLKKDKTKRYHNEDLISSAIFSAATQFEVSFYPFFLPDYPRQFIPVTSYMCKSVTNYPDAQVTEGMEGEFSCQARNLAGLGTKCDVKV